MAPTVAQVLDLPVLQAGRPLVLTDEAGLTRPVRWVHVGEIPDLAPMLHGGELILTTGIALPDAASELTSYVGELAAAGASGLVIELGRRFSQVPEVMVAAARADGLPVVALRRQVKFVAVTEVVHAWLLDEQHELLRLSERAHQEFTPLSIEGAPVQDILDRLSAMAEATVVLEDLAHRVVAFAGPAPVSEVLDDWEQRSRSAEPAGAMSPQTQQTRPEGWLVTAVGPRASRWGRLVLPSPAPAPEPLVMLLERAAEALTLNRLVERDQVSLVHQAHRALLTDVLQGHTDERELRARAEALGVPTDRRVLVGVVVRLPMPEPLDPVAAEARDRTLAEAVTDAVTAAGAAGLVAARRPGQVVLLLAVPAARSPAPVLHRFVAALERRLGALGWPREHVVGVGRPAAGVAESSASIAEAEHVADVALALPVTRAKPYVEVGDVRLHGLLAQLRDDPRVLGFMEAELGRLLRHDREHGGDLVALLRAFVDAGGNKSVLARTVHLSRPALYARLAAIERVLGVSLSEPDSLVAVHVALLVRDLVTGSAPAPRGERR